MIFHLLFKSYNTIKFPFFLGYSYLFRFYLLLKNQFYFYFPYFKPMIETPKSETEFFNEKYKLAFFYAIGTKKDFNENIEPDFYKKKEYNSIMKIQNNELETKWKSSILIKNTPRGNIIMCYDSFKLGFMYYCDNNVNYDILNSLASFYVIHFSCLDFFIDNDFYKENKSPFIDLYFKENNEEKEKEKKKNNLFMENRDVFVKKKPKSILKKDYKKDDKKEEPTEKPKEIFRNKFIKMGKVINFSFLNKPIIVNENNHFQSDWKTKIKKETDLQKELFNYKDFKKMVQSTA